VVFRVIAPVAVIEVKVAAAAVVPPIAMLLIVPKVPELIVIVPAPVVVKDWLLVVVLAVITPVAVKVVNEPVLGVVEPIGPGEAKVAPLKLDAFRLATLVVLETTKGAVPVETVEVICPEAEMVVNTPAPDALLIFT
jgi:hypothetical protein